MLRHMHVHARGRVKPGGGFQLVGDAWVYDIMGGQALE